MATHRSSVFAPLTISRLTLRNRVVRAGCFEGLSPGGLMTADLIERHRRVAAGGVLVQRYPFTPRRLIRPARERSGLLPTPKD